MTKAKNTSPKGQGADGDPYALTRFNATRHGLTSRHVVLPWESLAEFEAMHQALIDEHRPEGATEQHLVDQLAALFWRQQRVLQAECAEIRDELRERLDHFSAQRIAAAAVVHIEDRAPDAAEEAIRDTDGNAAATMAEIKTCEKHVRRAIAIIDRDGTEGYARALKTLHADTQEWWTEELEDREEEGRGPEPTASALRDFLTDTVLPFHAERMMALRHRDLFRSQAFGMAVNRADLERLGRYETTLDRKLQRILGMLLQLQDRRRTVNATAA
jgi:hypothetical protein